MSVIVIRRNLVPSRLKRFKNVNARCFSQGASKLNISSNILTNPVQLEIPRISLTEFIFSKTEEFSDFTHIECPLTGRKYTFGELRSRSKNFSKALRKKLGLQKGDVVLIYLPNIPEFPMVTLGCLEAGIIVSTVNSLYTPDEISRQLKDSSAKVIITCNDVYDNAFKALEKLQLKLPIICIKTTQGQSLPRGAIDFEELSTTVVDIPDLEPPNPDDIAILPYSSGTTGLPKGVRLSHYNIVANLTQLNAPNINFVEKTSANYQEIMPGVLPMFHIYGFTGTTLMTMINGARLLPLPRFSPDTFIDVLKNYNVTQIFAAPPLILFLTHHPGVKPEYFKHLRGIMSGAAPLGALDEEKFLNKAGKHVFMVQGYGLTETSPVVSMITQELRNKFKETSLGSVGAVISNTEAKLIKTGDLSGTPLGPNEAGELLVKGPQVMQGYHNNPEATQGTFLDGWLRTGDLAYYNEDGLLFITDRVKELIKVRGFQVAPAELEEILRHFPAVADAAVIGIPHEINGEVPRAYIQPKGDVNIEELHKFINEKVAKYKRLEGGIEIVKEIPKNSAGKILRRQLKQNYQERHA